jgi:hypothetical protein
MAIVRDHSSFVRPEDPGAPIWRYMDIIKFLRLFTASAFTLRA